MGEFRIERNGQWAVVDGPLTLATARRAAEAGRDMLADGVSGFDLSRVAECDSAALAVMVEWLRAGRGAGREIHFRAVPENLRAIAAISELDYLFE